ncbi:MAG: ATP-binding cassette domain-containing protein [Rhodomicrobium sp.]|nr:ATP-binding cassette domain-containing protein [Rhodomicrobium sp.]
MSYVEAERIFVSYGDVPILERVNLSVERGTFCTIVGASGCGKSTFLRLLLGQERPARGVIKVDGAPVPGERIVGIRMDDGSIKVHAIDCETLAREDPPQERWLDLKWRREAESISAYARISVTVRNEVGVLSDVAGVIARYGVSVANIKLRNRSPEFVEMVIDSR